MTPHDDILAALDLLHASYPDTAFPRRIGGHGWPGAADLLT